MYKWYIFEIFKLEDFLILSLLIKVFMNPSWKLSFFRILKALHFCLLPSDGFVGKSNAMFVFFSIFISIFTLFSFFRGLKLCFGRQCSMNIFTLLHFYDLLSRDYWQPRLKVCLKGKHALNIRDCLFLWGNLMSSLSWSYLFRLQRDEEKVEIFSSSRANVPSPRGERARCTLLSV